MILKIRQSIAKPILDGMFEKCRELKIKTYAGTLLGKAVNYMLNLESGLKLYLEGAKIPIDNNRIENDIRPFVIGRKNWLFDIFPILL